MKLRRAPERLAFPILAVLAVVAPATVAAEPPRSAYLQRPPWLLEADHGELMTEAIARLHAPPAFVPRDGGPDDSRASLVLDLSAGLGTRTEGRLRFGLQNVWGDRGSGGAVATDLDLDLGYSIREGNGGRHALAARLRAKVPTAPDNGSAGTDETDIGISVSGGTRSEAFGLFGSLGLDLLGNPLGNGSQDDVLSYGAGLWWTARPGLQAIGEVDGRAFSRFDNTRALARAGLRLSRAASRRELFSSGHLLLERGLTRNSPRWGFTLGLTVLLF